LNDGDGHDCLHDTDEVVRDVTFHPRPGIGNNECLGVYYPRLLRDGWHLTSRRREGQETDLAIFEKSLNKSWILRKIAKATTRHPVGKGVYYDEHELVNSKTGNSLAFPDWEWADVDSRRVVWAEGGKLYASQISSSGPVNVRLLRDFNADVYTRICAPY
jgi:hypothetical protein